MKNDGPQIRVLIAEDHPFFRFGLRARLAIEARLDIVGEAESGQQAIDMALDLEPDVVLMDLKLPGIGGIAATRQIRQARPAVQVLVLTMFDDDSALAALRAGARGYLLKSDDVEQTVAAIYAVAAGERRYSPSVAERLHRAALGGAAEAGGAAATRPRLTARQLETLQLIGLGLSTPEIAARLSIDERTVRNKVSEIYDALELPERERTRRSAILRAIELGLI